MHLGETWNNRQMSHFISLIVYVIEQSVCPFVAWKLRLWRRFAYCLILLQLKANQSFKSTFLCVLIFVLNAGSHFVLDFFLRRQNGKHKGAYRQAGIPTDRQTRTRTRTRAADRNTPLRLFLIWRTVGSPGLVRTVRRTILRFWTEVRQTNVLARRT